MRVTFFFRAAAGCVLCAVLAISTAGRADAAHPQDSRSAVDRAGESDPAASDSAAPAPLPQGETDPAATPESAPAEIPRSEYPPEAKALVERFEELRGELADAMADLRAIQLRYGNGIERSPRVRREFRQQRDRARQLLNQTYDLALELISWAPDKPAATFLLTLIQYREANDIYNASTFEGAARLLDIGLNYVYLFRAAGRSAVVTGQFESARRIYDTLPDENLEETDRRLKFQMDELERQWQAESQQREEDASKQLPRVRLRTSRGDAVIELFLDEAPSTVSHFIRLVDEGFYDGLSFYQVVEHVLALTGDPVGDGQGHAGRFIVDEHGRPESRQALRGSLVMAKMPAGPAGQFLPDSASSQFAILFLPMPQTSESQTVFGRVVEGMEVISSLRRVDPNQEKKKGEIVAPPDRILEAEVIRQPESLPKPEYVDPPRTVLPSGGG